MVERELGLLGTGHRRVEGAMLFLTLATRRVRRTDEQSWFVATSEMMCSVHVAPIRDGTYPCSCVPKKVHLPHTAHPYHTPTPSPFLPTNMQPPNRKPSTPIFRRPKELPFRFPKETSEERLEREARARWGLPPRKSFADFRPSRFPRFLACELSHPAGRTPLLCGIFTAVVLQYFLASVEKERKEKGRGSEPGTEG